MTNPQTRYVRAATRGGPLSSVIMGNKLSHRGPCQSANFAPPWNTCEAALSEAFHLLGARGAPVLRTLLRRGSLRAAFDLADQLEPALKLTEKYADVPTDTDFRVYRRHSRQVVPCLLPE